MTETTTLEIRIPDRAYLEQLAAAGGHDTMDDWITEQLDVGNAAVREAMEMEAEIVEVDVPTDILDSYADLREEFHDRFDVDDADVGAVLSWYYMAEYAGLMLTRPELLPE